MRWMVSELDGNDGHYVIEGSRLIIRKLKKGTEGRGDNAVYQCNAENRHGYVWANFYLNILGTRSFAGLLGPDARERRLC